MTVNLLQVDRHGNESITGLFQDAEEQLYIEWLMKLEQAAPGTTIFVHRLSEPGHYLCTVPCAYSRLVDDPRNPHRYCGCYDCIDQRDYLRTYTARAIIMDMLDLIPPDVIRTIQESYLKGSSDVLSR